MRSPLTHPLALAAILLLACAACRSTHPFHEGILVRNHLDTDRPEVSPAMFKADYVLYSRPSLEEEGEEVLFRSLVVADALGFSVEGEELFAISGAERIPLERGLYCWHIRPGTGPSELEFKARSLTGLVLFVGALSLISLGGLALL